MFDIGRDLWRSPGPTPLPRWQTAFEHLQRRRLHNLPGQPVPVLSQPHSKKAIPDVQRDPPVFQFVPIASGPVTGHQWKEPGSILFAPSLQEFMYTNKVPLNLLFSRLNSRSSLSLSSPKMLQSLHHLGGPLLDSLQYVHVSLVLGSPALDTVLQMWPHQC